MTPEQKRDRAIVREVLREGGRFWQKDGDPRRSSAILQELAHIEHSWRSEDRKRRERRSDAHS